MYTSTELRAQQWENNFFSFLYVLAMHALVFIMISGCVAIVSGIVTGFKTVNATFASEFPYSMAPLAISTLVIGFVYLPWAWIRSRHVIRALLTVQIALFVLFMIPVIWVQLQAATWLETKPWIPLEDYASITVLEPGVEIGGRVVLEPSKCMVLRLDYYGTEEDKQDLYIVIQNNTGKDQLVEPLNEVVVETDFGLQCDPYDEYGDTVKPVELTD